MGSSPPSVQPVMRAQDEINARERAFNHLKGVTARCFRMDVHFMLSFVIFVLLAIAFLIEFLLYMLVKGLVHAVENMCTPSRVNSLRRRTRRATSWRKFQKCSRELDSMTKREMWKAIKEDPDYDWRVTEKRLHDLRGCRVSMNHRAMFDCLKQTVDTSFFVNKAGALQEALFSRTYIGSKYLIANFVDEVCQSLRKAVEITLELRERGTPNSTPDSMAESLTLEDVRSYVRQLKRQWGSTALFLSGGAMLGWHHFGTLEALLNMELFPQVFCGTSAGAAIAAWACTRTDDELKVELKPEILAERLKSLVPEGWIDRLRNFFQKGYCCDIEKWHENAYKFLGDTTFKEAFEKTGRILNISLTRADRSEATLILNHKNAPNVLIAPTVIASCSFPMLGPPFHLQEKLADGSIVDSTAFESEYFHDGSIKGDIPLDKLREMWDIQYAIVSQVNPHVFPFCGLRAHGEAGRPVAWKGVKGGRWRGGFILSAIEVVLKEHMRFLLRLIQLLGVSPSAFGVDIGSLTQQAYCGNVTIHPRRIFWNHRRLMNDPSPKEAKWYQQEGRIMTYTKLSLISNRLRVDKYLDRLIAAAFYGVNNSSPFSAETEGIFRRVQLESSHGLSPQDLGAIVMSQ